MSVLQILALTQMHSGLHAVWKYLISNNILTSKGVKFLQIFWNHLFLLILLVASDCFLELAIKFVIDEIEAIVNMSKYLAGEY
jgi:hypothetical protein